MLLTPDDNFSVSGIVGNLAECKRICDTSQLVKMIRDYITDVEGVVTSMRVRD